MSSHKRETQQHPVSLKQDAYCDNLFRQALQVSAQAKPPRDAWLGIVQRVQQPAPPSRWQKFFSWVHSARPSYFLSIEPYGSGVYRKWSPSPFVGLMAKQMLDLRLAS